MFFGIILKVFIPFIILMCFLSSSIHNESNEVLQAYVYVKSFRFVIFFNYSMATILKIQDGRHRGVGANGKIGFWIQQGLSFPKMYSFPNLQE